MPLRSSCKVTGLIVHAAQRFSILDRASRLSRNVNVDGGDFLHRHWWFDDLNWV